MVKIRLSRRGRKKKPFYRIVVTDVRNARDSKYIERIGYYDPLCKKIHINFIRMQYWKTHGAQLTSIVQYLEQHK